MGSMSPADSMRAARGRRGQGPQHPDGEAPEQQEKRQGGGPGKRPEHLPQGGCRQPSQGNGNQNQGHGVKMQAPPPGARGPQAAKRLPLGQEIGDEQGAGAVIGEQGQGEKILAMG